MPSPEGRSTLQVPSSVTEYRQKLISPPVKEPKRSGRYVSYAVLACISALYLALRLRHLSAYSLWHDEVFSVVVAKSAWRELLHQALVDRVHPPLFYMVFKVWIAAVGTAVWRLRLFSVVFATLAIVPIWKCMQYLELPKRVCWLLLFALACNPFLILYSQEVRMYALLWFLSALSLQLYLREARRNPSNALWLPVINVCLVMVHLAGACVVAGECLDSVLHTRQSRRRILLSYLPATAAVVGWILAVWFLGVTHATAAHGVSWIPKPTMLIAWKTLAHLVGGASMALALNLPIALMFWSNRRRRPPFTLVFALLSITAIAGFLAFSLIVRPVWQERYFIICVLPYYLLAGQSIRSLSARWTTTCIVAIAAAGLVSLEYDLTHRADRPHLGEFVKAVVTQDHSLPILASDDIVASPLAYAAGLQRSSRVSVICSAPGTDMGKLNLGVCDIAYSVGQRDLYRDKTSLHTREFLYAEDSSSDGLMPTGFHVSAFQALGCDSNRLAETGGEGHRFTLYRVQCQRIALAQ